jgi:hypothetical protein
MGADKPIADVAELWRRRIEHARKQAKRLRGRYLELRYEDLVADPEPALRAVCDLVGLGYDRAMLSFHEAAGARLAELGDLGPDAAGREREAGERQSAHALAAEPPSQTRTEVWRTEMSTADREAFEGEAGGLLADLGYHLPS